MKLRYTPARPNGYRCPGDWQFDLIGKRLQIRIGRSQFAIWWMKRPYDFLQIANRVYGYGRPPQRA